MRATLRYYRAAIRWKIVLAFLIWLAVYPLVCGFPWRASCQTNCPGWPCRTSADCDTGSGCSCSGSGTGPGVCR